MYVAKCNSLKQASQIVAEDDLIQNIQYIEHTTNMHVLEGKLMYNIFGF